MSGPALTDTQVDIDNDEFLDLTNMVLSATEINGNWATGDNDNDDNLCSGSFTATLDGTFPGKNFYT